ncbi:hypothetical protein GQ55_1G391700 [Panicum hallii var. hallii]|uniref:Uncharacterized protein n=1 Tax=Panicum hallii var. hallii TaxID=1504633 RepID=A0A2T7FC74_9POAL|nr:hypothetical protein GQ55_1G391700 [Panicum hallii var. hallii]
MATCATTRNAFGSLAQNAAIEPHVGARAARTCPHTAAPLARVPWPPTRTEGGRVSWRGAHARSAPRPRAVDPRRPPTGTSEVSASPPRAGERAAPVARAARTRPRYFVRLGPGIARERFPQSSCSSLPYHPGLNLGGVFDLEFLSAGRSGRHRAGAVEQPSKINSIDASDGQRNATRWPVRQHVAIASANCMPWRINVPNTHSRP